MSASDVVPEFLTCPWCRIELAGCCCHGKPGGRPDANPDPNAEILAEAFRRLTASIRREPEETA